MCDPYLYKDVDVLKNKYNIRDGAKLDELIRNVTAIRMMAIDTVRGDFNYNHYMSIHKFVFGDIFEWAGGEREIEIHKCENVLGGMSVQYTYPSEIGKEAKKCIAKLNKTDWTKLSADQISERFAKDIAALWQTHPFREGNTRTTIAYACLFADAHGFDMDRQVFAENPKYVRDALVLASIGEYSEYEYLTRIFKKSMRSM